MALEQTLESKSFWQSKTFWVNTIMLFGSFIPAVKNHVTPEVLATAFPVANVILRFISKDKVTLT